MTWHGQPGNPSPRLFRAVPDRSIINRMGFNNPGAEAMADDVWGWCEKAGTFGRTVTVKVKFADFQQVTRGRSLPTPIARRATSWGLWQ